MACLYFSLISFHLCFLVLTPPPPYNWAMDILIYALIAVFLGWRLYSALGTRHEGERQRPNPFAASENAQQDEKSLLALPLAPPAKDRKEKEGFVPAAFLPAPDSLSGALYAIERADPSFEEKSFLRGARLAFEMIVQGYAAGEKEALKPLLSPVLFEAFKSGIEAREKAGERMEIKLLNLIDATLVGAKLEGRQANVMVEFVSDQARVIMTGDVVKENDGTQRLTDVWTFRRTIDSSNPNWMLVETKTA
jgi:predicted lipid-binding transport protein (Tim44 family)